MDAAVASELVAGLLAAGGAKELGEAAGGSLVAGIIGRVRKVFGSDARSVDALERARQAGTDVAVHELAVALAWYARRDQAFAEELAAWAEQADTSRGTQNVAADHSVAAAGDVTIAASGRGIAAGVIHGNVAPPDPTGPGPARQ
jgi:hypothetical protein